jgi:hypothetical protein
MKMESEGKVGDSATLRVLVKDLAFGSVSESGSVLVFHSVQIRLREWYQKFLSIRSILQKYGCKRKCSIDSQARFKGPIRYDNQAEPLYDVFHFWEG